jgi:aminoglycoside 6'-N-acetyltransferase I
MVREARVEDVETWVRLRAQLWPDADVEQLAREARDFFGERAVPTLEAVFVAVEAAEPSGFLELGVRAFADGCDSMPVPHVEGWYVEPFARGEGSGRALMRAAEGWARSHGFSELASDTEIENEASLRAHIRFGFAETERLIKLRKLLV